jgi:hypothetical protein
MREAASLLHLLGGMGSRHLVLIGGMVPPLLVPNAEVAHLDRRTSTSASRSR